MRQIIGIVIFIPLAVFIGVFAVENRAPLSLEIWPLAGVQQMWASVWILGLLATGIIFGLIVGWLAGTGWRRRARRAEKHIRRLEQRLEEREAAQISAAPPPSGGALPAPPSRATQAALIDD